MMEAQVKYTLDDFPPFPDEKDDTGRFKRAIAQMPPGSVLTVSAGRYFVKEITVTKSISLWFAEGTILEATDEATAFLFKFAGDVSANGYRLLREVQRGEQVLILPVATCDIEVGDLIWLRDDCARKADGQQEVNCEMHEVAELIYVEQELLDKRDQWRRWSQCVTPGLRADSSYDQEKKAYRWVVCSASVTGEARLCSHSVPIEAGRVYQLEVAVQLEQPHHLEAGTCNVVWEGERGEEISRSDVVSFSYRGWQIYYGTNLIAPAKAVNARISIGLNTSPIVQESTLWLKKASFKKMATKLVLKDRVRLPKRIAQVNVAKVSPLSDCRVTNFCYRLKAGASKGFGILAQQVRRFHVDGLYAEQGVESAIQVRRSMDVIIENFTVMPPQRVGSGQGYGVQFYGGNLGVIVRNGYAWRTRHAVDLDSTFDAVVENVTAVEGKGVSFLLTHNGWGGDLLFRHCRSIRSGSSGFVAEAQGVADPYLLMHPNMQIVDCYWQRESTEAGMGYYGFGVWWKAPVTGRVERFVAQIGTGRQDAKGHDNAAVRLLPVGNQLYLHRVAGRGLSRGIMIADSHCPIEAKTHDYIVVNQICLQDCQSAFYVNGGWGKRLFMSDLWLDRIKRYVIEGNQSGGYAALLIERVTIARSPALRFFQRPAPSLGSILRGWMRKRWKKGRQ